MTTFIQENEFVNVACKKGTVAWYRCTTPVLFCGHRRSPTLLEFLNMEENDDGHVE